MNTCAICTAEGDLHAEELDGRTVLVCSRCSDEHPRAGGYSFGQPAAPEPMRVGGQSASAGCRRAYAPRHR